MKNLHFLKSLIKDYRVGAVTKSSEFVIRKAVSYLKPRHKYVIEYGGGTGVVTEEILKVLPSDGRLTVVELNKDFISELKKIKDPRIKILQGDISKVLKKIIKEDASRIDAVICNIPFTFLKPQMREEIIKNTFEALKPCGIFVVFQYSTLILPVLKKYFGEIEIAFEWRNLPPYFFMKAEKK